MAEKLVDTLCLQRLLALIARNAEPIVFDEFAQRVPDAFALTLLMHRTCEVCDVMCDVVRSDPPQIARLHELAASLPLRTAHQHIAARAFMDVRYN